MRILRNTRYRLRRSSKKPPWKVMGHCRECRSEKCRNAHYSLAIALTEPRSFFPSFSLFFWLVFFASSFSPSLIFSRLCRPGGRKCRSRINVPFSRYVRPRARALAVAPPFRHVLRGNAAYPRDFLRDFHRYEQSRPRAIVFIICTVYTLHNRYQLLSRAHHVDRLSASRKREKSMRITKLTAISISRDVILV